jgi:hypothetical protein
MKKIIPILLMALALTTSCEKWLDVNDDPNAPTVAKLNQMLPGIYQNSSYYLGYNYMSLGYIAAVYSHQLTSRESIDQYGINGIDVEINWSNMYGILTDVEILITNAEESDNSIYAGIGKIYKAYLYSQMVDLWGNIPYNEANGAPEEFNPAFDDDEVIYASLIALINEAKADINSTTSENALEPGSDDLIYSGNKTKWIKAANSLLLKLYVQARNVSTIYNQAAVDEILASASNYIAKNSENFSIPYGTESTPDNRNPGMVSEYAGSQISAYISPWFYEIMKGELETVFEGVEDPRIPYYFATQLDDDNPTPENSVEYQYDYFVSIYFGSQGVNRDAAGRKTFTMLGLYPVGGAFDSPDLDRSVSLKPDQATGNIPHRLITAADVQYLIAELIYAGKASGTIKDVFEDAMVLSFGEVNVAAGLAKATTIADTTRDNYIDDILAAFDAATTEVQFEYIMTQKWIQKFGSSIDSYTDYRRTGYPVIFDPNTMIAKGGPDGNGVVPVQATRSYPVSFPWSAEELALNSSAPGQKNIATDKIFWDN